MYSAIAANKRNTYLIIGLFIAIIAGLGFIFSMVYGSTGIFWGALIGGGIYALIQYFLAAKIALAVNGAQEITKRDNPLLYNTVENIAMTDGLPMPRVYIISDPAPNAFATGRDPQHAYVAATTGLLEIMEKSELQGVIAHEMGHVKNYDIRVMMIVFGLVSAIGLIADMFMRFMWFGGGDDEDSSPNPIFMIIGVVAALISPFVAMLVQLAVSRQREYLADATGVMTTRHPEGLVRALEKLKNYSTATQRQNASTAHLFFANPLKSSTIANWFSTHPPLEDRIARLRGMEGKL